MPDPYGSESTGTGDRSVLWWTGTLVLAAVAAGILVLSSDPRALRLGLVAALWGALMAAFATARLRSRTSRDSDRITDLQRIYELELEREVAARREYELEAENEARRQVAEESTGEIQSLRSELHSLRQKVEQLMSSDAFLERIATRAETVRSRSHPGRSASAPRAVGDQRFASAAQRGPEPVTRLMGRLSNPPPPPPARRGLEPDPSWPAPQDQMRSEPSRPPAHAAVAASAPASMTLGWSGQADVGAHTQGTSVTELLAAHGVTDSGRRRRRLE
jgi:hypothetical protein